MQCPNLWTFSWASDYLNVLFSISLSHVNGSINIIHLHHRAVSWKNLQQLKKVNNLLSPLIATNIDTPEQRQMCCNDPNKKWSEKYSKIFIPAKFQTMGEKVGVGVSHAVLCNLIWSRFWERLYPTGIKDLLTFLEFFHSGNLAKWRRRFNVWRFRAGSCSCKQDHT